MENRRHYRIETQSLDADISDGHGIYTGKVDNISRSGLSIADLPIELDSKADIITAVIRGKGEHFKMFLKPRWESPSGKTKAVGLEIESSTYGWTEFVLQFEPHDEEPLFSTAVH